MNEKNEKSFAVLIDSDNVSSKYMKHILDEMTKHGVITYRRIYGDFTSSQMTKWKSVLADCSITPIQQFPNTVGKNATDSALIIDAMDILYTGNVDGFCLVSSDSDFTRLASRLRESGMEVIGMGEKKTPSAFRKACSQFTYLEVLLDEDQEKESKKQQEPANIQKEKDIIRQDQIADAITEIITTNENKGKDTGLGEIGSALIKKYSDFDARNYGYSSLSRFIEQMGNFELVRDNTSIKVLLKADISEMEEFTLDIVRKSGSSGIELGQLAQKIYNKKKNFQVKKFGYSTFQKFVQGISDVRVDVRGKNQKFAVLNENKKSKQA